MCGIAGMFDLIAGRPVPAGRVQRMCTAMVHRGPDGEGYHAEPGLGLGHRRLAVVDLSGGEQPMADPANRSVIVFNGEIYNHRPLRRDLMARGFGFQTRSDTEVILQAWQEWGAGALDHLTGMFAFAHWDRDRQRLTLARDPLGEKPLYYTQTPDGWLVFASELTALLAGLDRVPDRNVEAVSDYFAFGYVPDPKTIYRDIHKLPPACTLTVQRGVRCLPEPKPYWRLSTHQATDITEAAAREELTARLSQAVLARAEADVPLGAFLSGGVDSSAVVALLAEAGGPPVRTCSMGFADPAFDESGYAALVAERYGTDHVREEVEADAVSLTSRLAEAFGEPFADASAVPTFLVSQAVRKRVTVALSGDGGDEIFAGYRRYPFFQREEAVKTRLPARLRRAVFGPLARWYPKADWAPRPLRAKASFEALAADRAGGYFRSIAALPAGLRTRLLHPDLQGALGDYDPADVVRHHMDDAGTRDPLAAAQYADMKTWLAGRMLVKVDRMSMANSLEVRAPMLDPALVQWAVSLPPTLKIDGFEGKWLLKRALEPLLPDTILYRKKQGFSMPLAYWLRHGFGGQLSALTDPAGALAQSGLINMAFARRLASQHTAGLADHAQVLWALVMFGAHLSLPKDRAAPPAPLTAGLSGHFPAAA